MTHAQHCEILLEVERLTAIYLNTERKDARKIINSIIDFQLRTLETSVKEQLNGKS